MRVCLWCVVLAGCNSLLGVHEFTPAPDAPPATGGWSAISVGTRHACGIDQDARLLCWGDNRYGQLGLPLATLVPALVGAGTEVWTDVAIGDRHTCAVHDGQAWCWGQNAYGQITGVPGADVVVPRQVPLPVGAPPVERVVAGSLHSCALGGGQVWCWGDARATTVMNTTMPTQIGPNTTWSAISAGLDHTCAIDSANALWCWGANELGQTGQHPNAATVPAEVALPAPVLQVAAGSQATCALLGASTTGQIWCWGGNDASLGTSPGSPTPMAVIGGETWTGVVTGNHIACGLIGNEARCWGTVLHGGLGDGVWSEAIPPTAASRSFRADAIAIGIGLDTEESLCALSDHELTCWGDNRGGQLGVPATLRFAPVSIPSPAGAGWANVTVGTSHTCARDITSHVYCWGANDLGQVTGVSSSCTSSNCDAATPVAAPFDATATELIAGADFTCAHAGPTIGCWGTNAGGQLGVTDASVHMAQHAVDPAVTLLGDGHAACEATPNSTIACWGMINGTPQRVPGPLFDPNGTLSDVVSVAFGDHAAAAVIGGGERVHWGFNYQAEFGNNADDPLAPLAPPTVATDGGYRRISMTARHACAVTIPQKIACWGSDYNFETGDETPDVNVLTLLPHPVGTLQSCTRVATSFAFSCGVCSGVPSCWGSNASGRLGRDADLVVSDANPAAVTLPMGATWTEVGTGDAHACTLATDGTLACWGLGVRGQLGDGSHGSSVPVPIALP